MKRCSFLVIIAIMLAQLGCVFAGPSGEAFLPTVCEEGQASTLKVTFNFAENEMFSKADIVLTIRPEVPDQADLSVGSGCLSSLTNLPGSCLLAIFSRQSLRNGVPNI